MKLQAIIAYTFREGLARKTIITFAAISTFFLLIGILVAILAPDTITMPAQDAQGQQQNVPIGSMREVTMGIQAFLTWTIFGIAIYFSVFATASILPNMMEKGSIDLLLSKPVRRGTILLGSTIGATLIVAANVSYFVVGMWVISGLRTGFWNWGFLAIILPITFGFVVLYAPMMAMSIASRSSALSIIVVYAYALVLGQILEARDMIAEMADKPVVGTVLDFLYYPLPKVDGLSKLANALVMHQPFSWEPVWTSALFAAALFALAWWQFSRKNF